MVYLEPTLFSGELDVCLEDDLREERRSIENNIGNHQKPLSLKKKREAIYDRRKGHDLSSLHLTFENFSEYVAFEQALKQMFLMMQLAKDSNDPRLLK